MTNYPYNETVFEDIGWTTEQIFAYKRWRNQYGCVEHVIFALCPSHLKGLDTLPEKLAACYWNVFVSGQPANDPVNAVDGKLLKKQIQQVMENMRQIKTEGKIK